MKPDRPLTLKRLLTLKSWSAICYQGQRRRRQKWLPTISYFSLSLEAIAWITEQQSTGKYKTELGIYLPFICPPGFRASLLPDPEVNILNEIYHKIERTSGLSENRNRTQGPSTGPVLSASPYCPLLRVHVPPPRLFDRRHPLLAITGRRRSHIDSPTSSWVRRRNLERQIICKDEGSANRGSRDKHRVTDLYHLAVRGWSHQIVALGHGIRFCWLPQPGSRCPCTIPPSIVSHSSP